MQKDTNYFLPYFFTEPIYFVKKDLDGEKIKHDISSQETATTDSEPDARQLHEKNPLVNEPAQRLDPKPALAEPSPILKYFGKNLKKVLILFENKDEEKLPAPQEIFLGKIIHAVGLNFDDIALVNTAHLSDVLMEQLNHFDARIQMSFGIKSQLLPFKPDIVPYKIYKDSEKALLLTDNLETIEKVQEKKVLLWNNLKTLFSKS